MPTADPSPAQSASKPNSGRIVPFGKYLLLQRVSIGGMAEIFKAVPEGAKRLDNILAIKRILPNIAEDDEFIGMFVDEARIAGQLTHPNICRIYELGKVGDTNYIAMQYLWGRDLLKVINRFKRVGRETPPPLVAYVGARACAGLHYAHTKRDAAGQPLNIIHRDVSPQNIVVGYSGQVKLIDFGVARAASQSQKTQAGVLKGKFGYMSPEMIKGHTIDARSDVFAMGICLWEALTGQRLFYGESDFATLELVRDANVPLPSSKVRDIPPELDAVVMKALAAEPTQRYASADALRVALEEVLATHYSGFREADLVLIMRQAFHHEVTRERERLAVFEGMMARGELMRGAELPATPPAPASGERPRQETGDVASPPQDPNAKVVHEVSDEDLARLSGTFHGVDEEPTTIFFSADELEEITELSGEEAVDEVNPLDVQQQPDDAPAPAATDLLMPGPPVSAEDHPEVAQWADLSAFEALPPETAPSRAAGAVHNPASSRRPPSQTLELPLDSAPLFAHEEEQEGRSATVWIAVLAILIGALTYAGVRTLRPGGGTLVVNASGAPGAVVRVDGVTRGNPPVQIPDLSAGIHLLEVDAPGYEKVKRRIVVHRGQSTPVNLVLQHATKGPAVTSVARPSTSPAVEATSGAREGEGPEHRPRRRRSPRASAPRTRARRQARSRARAQEEAASSAPAAVAEQTPEATPGIDEPAFEETTVAGGEGTPTLAATEAEAEAEPETAEAETAEAETAEAETAEAEASGVEITEPGTAEAETIEPETAEAEAEAAPATGELMISTLPWSRVYIDNVDTGRDTPVRALKVPPGHHTVGLKTSDGNMHLVEVDIQPDKVVRIIRRFSTPPPPR